jgi:delta 1-pyrroline-5-carboxylate dehydrogenase
MATLAPDEMKITYTTSAADMDEIHAAFDEALEKVRSECGRQYPAYVNGVEVRSDLPPIVDASPIEICVTYVNKRSGATTGAWPGAQSFCGWKASGSSGKGGCGPYYVMQFMREQSRCVIEEK